MKVAGRIPAILIALCIGAGLMYAWQKLGSFRVWDTTRGDVRSGAPEEILVMRTKGGLLEVSRIRATEVFETRFGWVVSYYFYDPVEAKTVLRVEPLAWHDGHPSGFHGTSSGHLVAHDAHDLGLRADPVQHQLVRAASLPL